LRGIDQQTLDDSTSTASPSITKDEVQFYAFDILVADGEDVRQLPLSMRKTNLSRLFERRVDGIFLSDFEQGEIGPDFSGTPVCLGWKG
jgi:bifunctional non-homologous end joining protein LigD